MTTAQSAHVRPEIPVSDVRDRCAITGVLVELDDEPSVRFVTDLPGRSGLVVGTPMVVRFDEDVPSWQPA